MVKQSTLGQSNAAWPTLFTDRQMWLRSENFVVRTVRFMPPVLAARCCGPNCDLTMCPVASERQAADQRAVPRWVCDRRRTGTSFHPGQISSRPLRWTDGTSDGSGHIPSRIKRGFACWGQGLSIHPKSAWKIPAVPPISAGSIKPRQVIHITAQPKIEKRRDSAWRLPKQARPYSPIVGPILAVENPTDIAGAIQAQLDRLCKDHRDRLGRAVGIEGHDPADSEGPFV